MVYINGLYQWSILMVCINGLTKGRAQTLNEKADGAVKPGLTFQLFSLPADRSETASW